MTNQSGIDLDEETIKDFLDEFDEMYELFVSSSENILKSSNVKVSDIDPLFRAVHSVKSNLRMVGLSQLSELVHHLENILDNIRRGKFSFSIKYLDLIRLVLDETRVVSTKFFEQKEISDELEYLTNAIEQICHADTEPREHAVDVSLKLLDPFAQKRDTITLNEQETPPPSSSAAETSSASTQTVDKDYPHVKKDLEFFQDIALAAEKRVGHHPERLKLNLMIAKSMNESSGTPTVDPDQLEAAALIVNWGLSILPVTLLNKGMLSDEEQEFLYEYPIHSNEFFKHLPYWKTASEIVIQCHECSDGTGYPKGLKESMIHDGAKILSIAMTYTAILHSNAYININARTIMSAILEINKAVGTQFSADWVDVFNSTIKELHDMHKV